MDMTIEPQVALVQDAGVTGAAGAGCGDELDDDMPPPPQALRAAISKEQAAPGNHRRRWTHALIARGEHCIEISSFW
jgi:hypothetical protein